MGHTLWVEKLEVHVTSEEGDVIYRHLNCNDLGSDVSVPHATTLYMYIKMYQSDSFYGHCRYCNVTKWSIIQN